MASQVQRRSRSVPRAKRSSKRRPRPRPRPMRPEERHADWTARHDAYRDKPSSLIGLDLLLEILLMTIVELNGKLDSIATGVDGLKQQIADLKNQPPAVATQADLDQLGAKMDAVQAAISA